MPPHPVGPPPPIPKPSHKPPMSTATKSNSNQCNPGKVSVRQDSSVSSDSFSQTSSPSYTSKTMETPLLPPRTVSKHNNVSKKPLIEGGTNTNTTITKSASTPAGLQTIVRFHNGSNMSLHHRVCTFIKLYNLAIDFDKQTNSLRIFPKSLHFHVEFWGKTTLAEVPYYMIT